jgi:GAF domain-containing protein
MEPIPETVEAIDEYGPFGPEGVDLIADLRERGRRLRDLVPDCIGFSIESRAHGVTFTLVADDEDRAVLDAVHNSTDGSAGEEQYLELLDEDSWQLSGRASAAQGVRSTLTLPIVTDQRVAGSVNLYGSSGRAFTGHHLDLAALFDAWAPGAVTNADLSFTTLEEARRAPQVLKDEVVVHVAVGIVAVHEGLDVQAAERALREASVRAGVSLHDLAKAVLEASRRRQLNQ